MEKLEILTASAKYDVACTSSGSNRPSQAGGMGKAVIMGICHSFAADMIYDKTHGMALIHKPGQQAIIPLDEWVPPAPDKAEEEYRSLWKGFYNAIGIQERRNDRLRASLMPRRYWKHLPEMNDNTAAAPVTRAKRVQQLSPQHSNRLE
ncbi:DUF4130 domain-containing protein [Paenibacillus sp. sgz5001063]|uniref:DUF4130 domain-containing protein n=1 Tax=Paenibacillus sp. sgz5001063 TaxID=3242474 RepID=UPI0036D3203C